jgi:hypothetical protein
MSNVFVRNVALYDTITVTQDTDYASSAQGTEGVFIEADGDVEVMFRSGNTQVIPNRVAGEVYRVKWKQIVSTNTTATVKGAVLNP